MQLWISNCSIIQCISEYPLKWLQTSFWISTEVVTDEFLNIHWSGYRCTSEYPLKWLQCCLVVTWLVPCETVVILLHILSIVYNYHTMHQFTMPLNILSHICRVWACVFSCNLPHALFAESPGSFTCYCGNRNRYWNERHHRKLTLVKKILPLPLPGIKPATFWSQVCQWSTAGFSLKISISDRILCPQTQSEHIPPPPKKERKESQLQFIEGTSM